MLKWQRTARWLIAITAISFAVLVGSTLRTRSTQVAQAPLPGTDPKAVAESGGGLTFRVNGNKEELRIEYETSLTYQDGSSKILGVKATTERNGGKTFTMTGKEGTVGDKESTVDLSGGVHVVASDGLELWTDRASYNQADSTARSDGKVDFSRGRMKGSGVGFIYDKNHDILTVLDQTVVDVVPDEAGIGGVHVTSGAMEFRRDEKSLRFDRAMQATRAGHLLAADTAVAHLSEDEQRLETLELRGQSSITAQKPTSGALRSMTGRDMDLKYAADGDSLEHAVVNGNGAIQIAGESAATGREIIAQSIDLMLAPDGTTLTRLVAHESVRLTLPPDHDTPGRIITSTHLESQGDADKGLTRAVFSQNVEFSERSETVNRTAHASTLSAAVGAGFSSVEEARFTQNVRFVDGDMTATAALARYVVQGGTLELSGSEPQSPTPHVVNAHIRLDAARMDVTLAGPDIKATGAVKSLLLPGADRPRSDGRPPDRMPSMLKQDKPVNVTAAALDYRGSTSRAVYSGGVLLWQGETSIKAPTLTIDSEKGDLNADGLVTTVAQLVQEKDGKRESVRSTATAKTFQYEDANRRATYTGEAHVSGPAGDLTAPKIEMYMKASGDELERLEAYDGLTLRVNKKKTTGARLTYFSDDERYLVMAFGKLQEVLPQRPMTYKGQNLVNFGIFGAAAIIGIVLIVSPTQTALFPIFVLLSLLFGVLLIIPIGGADMPTVIALLNSYAGLSASAMGFVLNNRLLIVAGALDGSSGFILSIIMCRAMNRSFTNVLFGAFGQLQVSAAAGGEAKPIHSASPEEAAQILDAARTVIVIPGYGMAVSQAQHKLREMFDLLGKRGVNVEFAIHPVAGRMPGHMNVLLAEADVPYDKLREMDDINPEMAMADVALIIGANDVVNPDAENNPNSPIAGMPIIQAYKARTVMVIKRSMNPGFAGIDNPLYYLDNTLMLFGDAKSFLASIVKELQAVGKAA